MGREGYGCRARTRPERENAHATRGARRSAGQAHQSGEDARVAVVAKLKRGKKERTKRENMKRLILALAACALLTAAVHAQTPDHPLIKVRFAFDGYAMTSGPL